MEWNPESEQVEYGIQYDLQCYNWASKHYNITKHFLYYTHISQFLSGENKWISSIKINTISYKNDYFLCCITVCGAK